MRPGDVLKFSPGDDPSGPPCRATVRAVLFISADRRLPDRGPDPWREVAVIETANDSVLIRDRMRVRDGSKVLSQPRWSVGTVEEMTDLLLERSRAAEDISHARLYTRALMALERWSSAEAV